MAYRPQSRQTILRRVSVVLHGVTILHYKIYEVLQLDCIMPLLSTVISRISYDF
jgi:hypothetical protein